MRYALAALLLAACADDIATRDYTVSECPAPPARGSTAYYPETCDRGVGQTPRFVTIEACASELGLAIPSGSWGLSSTHPARERCVNAHAAALNTLDDVRTGITRAGQ